MIYESDDWLEMLLDCGDDMDFWVDGDPFDYDWDTMLKTMVLLTDDDGSYGLFEPITERDEWMGHVIICPRRRGKDGYKIAKEMIDYFYGMYHGARIFANTKERHTRLWLRKIGFEETTVDGLFKYK